jgi:hypothetical protein
VLVASAQVPKGKTRRVSAQKSCVLRRRHGVVPYQQCTGWAYL